jgi:hypothetical protein
VVDFAEKAREARLRWCGHTIRSKRTQSEKIWNEKIR